MIYLFFLTRKWGTEDCEISSFNYDLCNAVAKQSQLGDGKTKVYCLSLTAESDPDKNSAKENNIMLLTAEVKAQEAGSFPYIRHMPLPLCLNSS